MTTLHVHQRDKNHIQMTETTHEKNLLDLVQAPCSKIEGAGFMTCNAPGHQGAIKSVARLLGALSLRPSLHTEMLQIQISFINRSKPFHNKPHRLINR